jgi:hypothetical protein
MSACQAMLMTMIFSATGIYRIQTAGLNPFELVLVGTALEASYFLLEVPTGVMADTYSRCLSVVAGVLLVQGVRSSGGGRARAGAEHRLSGASGSAGLRHAPTIRLTASPAV